MLSHRDGFESQTLGRLISHFQTLELSEPELSKFRSLVTQVQFQIDFREVEIAQRVVITIGNLIAAQTRRAKHIDRPAVFAAQKIEIGDVVICLSNQEGHAMLFAILASVLVSFKRLLKFAKAYEADRQIAQYRSDAFSILVFGDALIGFAVAGQRICKPVLAVVHIADIDFEPRQP